jgi:hypothetical protein
MTREEKYDKVNQCETEESLKAAIISFADDNGDIQGRSRKFSAVSMSRGLRYFMEGDYPAEILTREFGIRQQAIYVKSFGGYR